MLTWILNNFLTIFVLFTCIRCSLVITTNNNAGNALSQTDSSRLGRRGLIPIDIKPLLKEFPKITNEKSCSILSSEILPIILISTVDGSLHCVNKKTGKLLWSQEGYLEPLVTSYHSKPPTVDWDNIEDSVLESDEEILTQDSTIPNTIFMTEPVSQGIIYTLSQLDGTGYLERSKFSFKSLVEQTPFSWNNRIYLGSKKTRYFALDPHTGEIMEEFDENHYMSYRTSLPKGLRDPLLMIGRIDYTLRIHDQMSNHLIANLTFRDFVPDFMSQLIGMDGLPEPEQFTISPDIFDFPIVSVFDILLHVGDENSQCVTRKLSLSKTVEGSNHKKQRTSSHENYFFGSLDENPYVMSPEHFPYITSSKFMKIYKAGGGLGQNSDSLIKPGDLNIVVKIDNPKALENPISLNGLPPSDSKSYSPFIILPFASLKKVVLFIFTLGLLIGWAFTRSKASYVNILTPPSASEIKKKTKKIKGKQLQPSVQTLPDGSTVINSLTVSNNPIGYGSHGTIVYKGKFQNRDVAVKRMLIDLYHIGEREVKSLQQSDDHSNVIRYYCMEQNDKFLYLALELCPMSLHGLIEGPRNPDFPMEISQTEMLYQMMNGLNHLHSLKIVHRDIKPQNILVSLKKDRTGKPSSIKLLISDFGLSKRLDDDQSSFHNTIHSGGTGTAGWRAPECLLNLPGGMDDMGSADDNSYSFVSTSAEQTEASNETNTNRPKLSRAIDIFSMGCVFYYVLSNGQHPFGNRFVRESRIIEGKFDLSALLSDTVENKNEAYDLVEQMISTDPKQRPSSSEVLLHPYFWSPSKKLNFLQDVSDRLEGESRDPISPLLQSLEGLSVEVLGDSWYYLLDKCILNDLKRFRGYDGTRIQDLLRVVRNKKNHYNDLPPYVKKTFGSLPDEYLNYFTSRFPQLLLHTYYVVSLNEEIRNEKRFQPYFESYREN